MAAMEPAQSVPLNPEIERQKLKERLGSIVGRLETEAQKRVAARKPIEDRMLEDLKQYHGRYDDATEANLQQTTKSRLFLNLTKPKTDALAARLMDILFPTDDKNWGINPTPVPQLTEAAEKANSEALKLKEQVAAAEQPQEPGGEPGQASPQLQQAANEAQTKADELQLRLEEARRRASLMETEIDDALKESNYHAIKRDQIEDACKYGTGVTKGPVTGDKIRKGWKPQIATVDGVQTTDFTLQTAAGDQPAMRGVDIWNFFPDMGARTPQEGEGTFERHLMNAKRLKGLAKLPGFDKDAIRRLLAQKPRMAAPTYLASIRAITGDKSSIVSEAYQVWEYSGPLSTEDMRDLALATGDEGTLADLDEIDPLADLQAIIWLCDGEVLKFAVYPMDSGECMYSVYNIVKDESSIFGFGVPSIMRDPQKSLNAAWRAMMDNAGLASGPQIVNDRSLIEPADGVWEVVPRKQWWSKDAGIPQQRQPFQTFDIPMRQAELANIIVLSKQFIDDMTSMPMIAQGEQGTGVTKTAQGMALLMNSANVVFRRYVKNFDDDVTIPDIRRFYDWFMQFSPKQEIKGDYEVDARGSSVLLVRELQSQNLMFVATQLGAHPIYGPMLRQREVLRKLFQSMMIPAADVVLTDTEIDAILMQASANDSAAAALEQQNALKERELQVREQEIDRDVAVAEMQAENQRYLAGVQQDTQLISLAEKLNWDEDKLLAQMADNRAKREQADRHFAVELADKRRTGTGAGGLV